jgi:hypothetical protein
MTDAEEVGSVDMQIGIELASEGSDLVRLTVSTEDGRTMGIYGDAEWARKVGRLLIGMADSLGGGGSA